MIQAVEITVLDVGKISKIPQFGKQFNDLQSCLSYVLFVHKLTTWKYFIFSKHNLIIENEFYNQISYDTKAKRYAISWIYLDLRSYIII